MDEDKLLQMSTDQIRFIFENEYGESFLGLETLTSLIARGGDIHLAGGNEVKAEQCYMKAMELFNVIEIESGTFSLDRQAQMGKISQLLYQIKNDPQ